MSVRRIYDISPRLDEDIPVWPGDTPLQLEAILRLSSGATVNLSTLRLSLHTGAHADSPWHFDPDGDGIDELPLEPFVGPARLVTLDADERIDPGALEAIRPLPERLLLRINPQPSPSFATDFAAVGESAGRLIAADGVRLLGTDGPSVDRFDSQQLPTHHALASGGVQILEGLAFGEVPDGDYELIALPLKIHGADGSPVRAVLREL